MLYSHVAPPLIFFHPIYIQCYILQLPPFVTQIRGHMRAVTGTHKRQTTPRVRPDYFSETKTRILRSKTTKRRKQNNCIAILRYYQVISGWDAKRSGHDIAHHQPTKWDKKDLQKKKKEKDEEQNRNMPRTRTNFCLGLFNTGIGVVQLLYVYRPLQITHVPPSTNQSSHRNATLPTWPERDQGYK